MSKGQFRGAGRREVLADDRQDPSVKLTVRVCKAPHRLTEAVLDRQLGVPYLGLQFRDRQTPQVWMGPRVGAKLDSVTAHLVDLRPMQQR